MNFLFQTWISVQRLVALILLTAISLIVGIPNTSPNNFIDKVKVTQLTEELLYWPDIETPVGIKLRIELTHPTGFETTMLPPQIIMGHFDPNSPPKQFFQQPYYVFTTENSTVNISVLKAITKLPDNSQLNSFNSLGTTSVFTYELFPGNVLKANIPNAFCLFDAGFESSAVSQKKTGATPDTINLGSSLSTHWVGITAQGPQNIDLSKILDQAVQRFSQFQNNPTLWQQLHRTFFPERLRANHLYERVIFKGHELCFSRGDVIAEKGPTLPESLEVLLTQPELDNTQELALLKVAVESGNSQQVLNILGRIQLLGSAADNTVPYLVELLKNHSALASHLALTLAKIGQGAVSSLVPLTKASNPEIRRRAISTLGMIGPKDQSGIDALVNGLEDSDQSVRRFSAFALANVADHAPQAFPKLQHLAKNDSIAIRHSATTALSAYGNSAVPSLAERLANDENKSVRIAAVRGLLHLGSGARSVEPVLRAALNDSDKYVRQYAERALANLAQPSSAQ